MPRSGPVLAAVIWAGLLAVGASALMKQSRLRFSAQTHLDPLSEITETPDDEVGLDTSKLSFEHEAPVPERLHKIVMDNLMQIKLRYPERLLNVVPVTYKKATRGRATVYRLRAVAVTSPTRCKISPQFFLMDIIERPYQPNQPVQLLNFHLYRSINSEL